MNTDSTASAESEPEVAEQASQCQSDVIIQTRNLSKIYRDFWGRKKVNALKSLDIEVRQGEIFGLLGPNGSGKSTTIKLILGLLFPSSGRVLVFDKDASETSKNEKIGYLPEESYLYKFLTAEETLDFYGRLFDMSGAERKKRVEELIQLVGLAGAKHRQLREYSKGMTRRVGLAQARSMIQTRFYSMNLPPDLTLSVLADEGLILLSKSVARRATLQSPVGRRARCLRPSSDLHQGELKELVAFPTSRKCRCSSRRGSKRRSKE